MKKSLQAAVFLFGLECISLCDLCTYRNEQITALNWRIKYLMINISTVYLLVMFCTFCCNCFAAMLNLFSRVTLGFILICMLLVSHSLFISHFDQIVRMRETTKSFTSTVRTCVLSNTIVLLLNQKFTEQTAFRAHIISNLI